MPVNDTTTNQGYQKPNIANTLSDDVGRLRSALDSIDTDMAARLAKAGGVMTGALGVTAGTAGAPSVYFTGDTNTGIYSPGADQLAISTGGTGRLFVDANGNVGVNTSSPLTNGYPAFTISNNTQANLYFEDTGYESTGNGVGYFSWDNGALAFSAGSRSGTGTTGSSEYLRIDSSGRLLVGTSTSVLTGSATAATVQISSTVGLAVRRNENNSSPASITLGKSRSTVDGVYTILQNGDDICELRFAGDDGTNLETLAAKILCQVDSTPGADSMPGRLVFSTSTNASPSVLTERMRIDSSGRVGIGVTGPTNNLEVRTAGVTTLQVAYTGQSSLTITEQASGESRLVCGGTSSFLSVYTGSTPTEVARIDSSGRLLVGTSSDSGGALFQVNGDRIRVSTAKTPASATATGTTGEICWDANYIYVCTATNTWKRTAIATW